MRRTFAVAGSLVLVLLLGECSAEPESAGSNSPGQRSIQANSTDGSANRSPASITEPQDSADNSESAATSTPQAAQYSPGSVITSDLPSDANVSGWSIGVVAQNGSQADAVVQALQTFARSHNSTVTIMGAQSSIDDTESGIFNVIVGVGPEVAGEFDLASAARLDQDYLMLGTQLAEPTNNVTAVVWPGAQDRVVFADQLPTFTNAARYAEQAVETGIAAVSIGATGFVYSLEG